MTATALLAELRHLGATVAVVGERLRIEAPAGTVTPVIREALKAHKSELAALVATPGPTPTFDADAGEPAALLLRGTLLGDMWLVADVDVLADHPDILRAGLPVIFFDEAAALTGKSTNELRAIGLVKTVFPTARVLQ